VTLHNELADILGARGNAWMTTSELANAVNDRGHYLKKDASSVTAFQIHGRARQYPKLFERHGSRIRLTTGLVATPSDTERRYLMHAWKRDQWKFEQDEAREGVLLDHSASSSAEFGKLHAGDTLYVVGQSEDGPLMLIGRTDIVEVVSQRRAEAKLGYRLYKGTYHALGTNGTPRRFDVEIPEKVARAIRSTSRKPIKFDSDVDYRLARNALRPRRWLNEESARLLDDVIATANGGRSKTSERGRTQSPLGIRFVSVQDGHVEGYEMTSPARKRKAVRRESALVRDYCRYMEEMGDELGCHEIPVEDGKSWMCSDIFNDTRQQLIEAKASVKRTDVRMAIGQLADYGRATPSARRAVLFPKKPDDDLLVLLSSQDIAAIWKNGKGFVDTANGDFTTRRRGTPT